MVNFIVIPSALHYSDGLYIKDPIFASLLMVYFKVIPSALHYWWYFFPLILSALLCWFYIS